MNPNFAFFEGQVVPIEEAKVSIMTHALHYGTAVFGGMRAYWNDDEQQLFIFRSYDHFERLIQSAGLLRMELQYSPDELTAQLAELLRRENYHATCYIRPLVYKSSQTIGVRLHDLEHDIAIFAYPFKHYLRSEDGAHLCVSAWRRIDDNMIPARGKISGAYANSALIKTDAEVAGYDDALVLNQNGHVSEASAANIFIVRKGVAITPPIYSNILEGIVRRSVIQLLREEMGVEVVEREIDRTEIYLADEMFMCGTGVQISAVSKVEHRLIGAGGTGPITSELRSLFFDVAAGRVAKYRDWLTPVYQQETVSN